MSDLQKILLAAKSGLQPWEQIPESKLPWIAAQCGPLEIAELRKRIDCLRAELEATEPWDGDTIDDINRTIEFFLRVISLAV